jgi:hypothetical protein
LGVVVIRRKPLGKAISAICLGCGSDVFGCVAVWQLMQQVTNVSSRKSFIQLRFFVLDAATTFFHTSTLLIFS